MSDDEQQERIDAEGSANGVSAPSAPAHDDASVLVAPPSTPLLPPTPETPTHATAEPATAAEIAAESVAPAATVEPPAHDNVSEPTASEPTVSEPTASEPSNEPATPAAESAPPSAALAPAPEPTPAPEPATPAAESVAAESVAAESVAVSDFSADHDAPLLPTPIATIAKAVQAMQALGLDERIPPLRLTPIWRRQRVRPAVWGWLATAALLLLLPAMLTHVLWPGLSIASPFAGPPDQIPRGASAWADDHTLTPLAAANANFGAQTYPVDAQFAASYAARGGASALGPAVTPGFDCNLGFVQFFAAGALLHPSAVATPAATSTPTAPINTHELAPDLQRDGIPAIATDIEWLPLSHMLLTAGSAASIGGAGSSVTYATLRAATQPVNLAPKPTATAHVKANLPLPQTVVMQSGVFVVEGERAGKQVGHSIPAAIWDYIRQPQISPQGWLRDIGEPLTEPISVVANGSDGEPHHLLAQVFWQTIILTEVDAPQTTTMQSVGLDYLHTFGAPDAHPKAGAKFWTTQDGSLRTAPGNSSVAVNLNTNAPVTLTGAAQWNQGSLWYDANWSSPSRHGSAWAQATSLSAVQLSGPTTAGFDALSPSLASYLSAQNGGASAVVYDITRNTLYTYQPSTVFIMASSAKVPLMVAYLSMIESQGRGPNGFELSELRAMIEHSDNNAAQLIYDTIGYDSGQQSYMRSWGITDYSPNPEGWGWALWSPGDMARLLTLLQQGKVLNSADRALAFNLMSNIESDQRFGVGDTAPSNASVAMKDGWVPGPDGAWAVNTSGIVTIGPETYIITVYTGEQDSFGSGQDIVNHVCGAVAQALK